MNYAAIKDGIVINVIVWDASSEYDPGEGVGLVCIDGIEAGIGWSYANGVFTPPVE